MDSQVFRYLPLRCMQCDKGRWNFVCGAHIIENVLMNKKIIVAVANSRNTFKQFSEELLTEAISPY